MTVNEGATVGYCQLSWLLVYFDDWLAVHLLLYVHQIPADHLEALHVWNSDDLQPVHTVYATGLGLPNTDYIIYTQSKYTATCLQGVSSVCLCI